MIICTSQNIVKCDNVKVCGVRENVGQCAPHFPSISQHEFQLFSNDTFFFFLAAEGTSSRFLIFKV